MIHGKRGKEEDDRLALTIIEPRRISSPPFLLEFRHGLIVQRRVQNSEYANLENCSQKIEVKKEKRELTKTGTVKQKVLLPSKHGKKIRHFAYR